MPGPSLKQCHLNLFLEPSAIARRENKCWVGRSETFPGRLSCEWLLEPNRGQGQHHRLILELPNQVRMLGASGSGKGGTDCQWRDSWNPPCFALFPRQVGPVPVVSGAEPTSSLGVIVCLCPCSVGGLILDKTVSDPNFAGMAVFTPVINGEASTAVAGREGTRREKSLGVWHLCQ